MAESETSTVLDARLLIDGRRVETGVWTEVVSPYSGAVVGRVAWGDAGVVRSSVDAAERAMRQPIPTHERASLLDRIGSLLAARSREIADVLGQETGKPVTLARGEITRAVATFKAAAVAAQTLAGEVVPIDASLTGAGKLAFTLRVPVGVIGAITPFNFPVNLAAHKFAPALAAGCAVVLKPAERTPLATLLLAEIACEAGLPPGWLNVIVGNPAEIAAVFVEDPRVRLLAFTGSCAVGWDLRARAPRKRVTLELGNASPAIVEPDADLDDAAARLARNAFSFAGQSCISVQRVYVDRTVYEDFKHRFVAAAESSIVGDPSLEDTEVGPLISHAARDRVLAWIDEARSSGATVLTGGELRGGLLPPTVLEGVGARERLQCEEVFGPVCTLSPYNSLDEAIALANDTPYGLQAGIFTGSLASALRAVRALEFGGVLINEAPTFRTDEMPYGGTKASGNTREGPAWTIREMTEERLAVFELPSDTR